MSAKSRRQKSTPKTSQIWDGNPHNLPDEKSLPAENLSLSSYLKADMPTMYMLLATALGQVAWFRGALLARAIKSKRNKLSKQDTIKKFGIGRASGYRFLDIFECYKFAECSGKTMQELLDGITHRRNKMAKGKDAPDAKPSKPKLRLAERIINREPPKVRITEKNVIAELRRAVAIVKGVMDMGYLTDHVDDASKVLTVARRITVARLIGRLLLQQTTAAPCGELTECITDKRTSRQTTYLTQICALALPNGWRRW